MERPEHCRFRITLLGGLSVQSLQDTDAPRITRFATHKTAALLALMALAPGRRFSRDVLIDKLWPDASVDAGRRSLRVALTALRHVLEPAGVPSGAVLLADRNSISLRAEAVQTDVAEYEQAVWRGDTVRARQLYAEGPLLPTFYDDWALVERDRLESSHAGLPTSPSRKDNASVTVLAPPEVLVLPAPSMRSEHDRHLPFYLTRFIGRETERETLATLWNDARNRLITVSGPGGVGKTRFVSEAVSAAPAARSTRYVALADAHDLPTMTRSVLVALGGDPAKASPDTVPHLLQGLGPVRLILDNLEQLVPCGIGDLLLSWLGQCPNVQIIVTSRQRVGVSGEQELALAPLETPICPATPERLLDFACVRLFLDRARLARADAALTAHTANTVALLCERLGGLPLALEIIAAWAGVLTFRQMLEHIDTCLLDESGPPTAHARAARPERHRSLRAALDVSLELLSPSLKQTFAGLAVFRGSFTGEAATAVLGAESGSPEALFRLRERSLLTVQSSPEEDVLRFRLLPTVAVYARERLESNLGQACERAQAHCTYYSNVARKPRTDESTLDADAENLHYALDTAEVTNADTDLRLCAALWPFWKARGHTANGLQRLEHALSRHPNAPANLILEARHGAGLLAFDLCHWDDARRHHDAALALAEAVSNARALGRAYQGLSALALHADTDMAGATKLALAAREHYRDAKDISGEARILIGLGVIAFQSGDFEAACRFQTDGLRLAETTEDPMCIATARHRLGNTVMRLDRYEEAQAHYNSALTLFERMGSRLDLAYLLTDMATLAYYQDKLDETAAHYETAIPVMRSLGDVWALSLCLGNAGRLATDTGDLPRAKSCLAEALTLREAIGDKYCLLQSIDAIINLLIAAAQPHGKPVRRELARLAIQLRAADGALRDAIGVGPAFEHDVLAAQVPPLRALLGETTCTRLESDGTRLTLAEATRLAQEALGKIF